MRVIALALGMALLVPQVSWAVEHGEKDPVIATAGMSAWAATVGVSTGGLLDSMPYYSAAGLLAFGIIGGSIISYTTDPEREGRGFRWNGQTVLDTEERKFENNPNVKGWKRLKAYPSRGKGIKEVSFVSPIPENKKWTYIGDTGY